MAFNDDVPDIDNVIGDDLPDIEECLEYLKTNLDLKLPLAGGTMTGEIAMGANKITGLGAPENNADAATKGYADSIVGAGGFHADTHTDGTDDIQNATDLQKGLMTAADHILLTAASQAVDIAIDIETRDLSAVTGEVEYTGYGFEANLILFFSQVYNTGVSDIACSFGAAIGTGTANARCMYFWANGSTVGGCGSTECIRLCKDGGNAQKAYVSAIGADGFTLSWTKTGTPTEVASIMVLALKLK